MSTGKSGRSGRSKAQGWEEAGSEFYQESFPTDADGQVQKDPVPIATLLPSKQNRMGKSVVVSRIFESFQFDFVLLFDFFSYKKNFLLRFCSNLKYTYSQIFLTEKNRDKNIFKCACK